MPDPSAILAQSGFFQDFSESSRRRIAACCSVQQLPRRKRLFSEGEQGGAVFLLGRGRLQLFRSTADGREVVIKVVQPGELFAEVVLFEQPTYPVSALALADCTVLKIPRTALHELLAEPDFRSDFFAGLMKKLRYLTGRITELSTSDTEERLLGFLEEQLGGSREGPMPLAKQDVAAAIGSTPETLSRILQRLKRRGLLSWEDGRVRLMPTGEGDPS